MSSGRLQRICWWLSNWSRGTEASTAKTLSVTTEAYILAIQHDFDLRQACRLIALTTMQKTFAGMNPNCSVRNPITHMMMLLTPASAQPSQHRRPTRIVDATVRMQER